jgi:large subunit ribosomal protein L7e
MTPEKQAALTLLEPYVLYGSPNVQTVRDLIFKYGFMRYNGKKTSISSNTQIEEVFGESGIICLEDIIHEIVTIGPKFDIVMKALYPFILPNPKEGWIGKKGLSFQKGGIAGYRGDKINEFIKTVL